MLAKAFTNQDSWQLPPVLILIIWLILLTGIFLGFTLPFLANYPLLGGDDAWIMSVSHKWLTTGVFGSDMFAGYFGADQHYFINLPLHHLWQTIVFRFLGTGIAQARISTLIMSLLLLWLVSWLAFRWYGLSTGLITGFLLVFWRSGFIGTGIPLLLISRTGRYDAGALFWLWVAIGLLARLWKRPGYLLAFFTGVCCALATLTQFFGIFAVPLVAILWLYRYKNRAWFDVKTYTLAAGYLATIIPYALFVARHWQDFAGQRFLTASRSDFSNPLFYWRNILYEYQRYSGLLRLPGSTGTGYKSVSSWILVLAILPVFWYLLQRWRREREEGDTVLLMTFVVFGGCLALLEAVKAPVYGVILVPSICMTFAAATDAVMRHLRHAPQRSKWWWGTAIACTGAALVILAEGSLTYVLNFHRGQRASDYLAVGNEINSHLEPGATVIGFEQWWWALQDEHPYLAWTNLWGQWRYQQDQHQAQPLHELIFQTAAQYLVVSPTDINSVRTYPPALQVQFAQLLAERAYLVAIVHAEDYGNIEIYRVHSK